MDKYECTLKINSLELELLRGNFAKLSKQSVIKENFPLFSEESVNVSYDAILSKNFLCNVISKFPQALSTLEDKFFKLKCFIDEVVKSKNTCVFEFSILLLGVSALQEFLRYNWTGSCINVQNCSISDSCSNVQKHVVNDFIKLLTNEQNEILQLLMRDDEPIYDNVKYPELLLFSDVLLSSITKSSCITSKWWKFRLLMIHQHVLLNKSITIFNELKLLATEMLEMTWINKNKMEKLQLLIEVGLMHLHYHEIAPAKKYLSDAQDISGVDIELSGAFGKRTQFQQKPVAQLLIKLKRNGSLAEQSNHVLEYTHLPTDSSLEDDVLLNKVKFLNISDDIVCNDLLPEEQLVLLSQCSLIQKSQASDVLLTEKLMAYIDCILEQKKVWCIQFKALVIRCKLEKLQSRKVDRAIKQLEALLSAVKKEVPSVFVRQHLFYSVFFCPVWDLEKELANLLLSLGAVKSALDIYQRLQLWDSIVECYIALGKNSCAASLIRQKLEEKETPYLWCRLGDVTEDIDCYFKAWELSNHKNARSQSSLGFYYYDKGDFESSLPYFKKSVEINYLQKEVWFKLGFAAIQVQDYELAAHAYRNAVIFEPDSYVAWNNLSNAYIRLKQKERAYKTLQEALRCNYEEWKVWENYLLVCVDVGAFDDAIQAIHRLLDIKGKYDDAEVLGTIAKAINTNVEDFSGQGASRLKKKALKLFGRITSVVFNDSDIWKHYASFHASDANYLNNSETMELVVRYLQKSLKCATLKPRWDKDIVSCKQVVCDSCYLADMYCSYLKIVDDNFKVQYKWSAGLMFDNILIQIERQLNDFQLKDAEELKEMISSLKSKLANINAF